MKNVLVISTSLRPGSNSEALAEAFLRGAQQAGHRAELVTLRGLQLQFCRGCMACQGRGRCVLNDDAQAVVDKMHDADVIAFATPIYYYEMCGQMKTLLDRANPLFEGDYRFTDIYLLTTAAEDEADTPKKAESGLCGWIDCFERARLAGTVFAGGVTGVGEIAGHPALDTALALGRGV